jgi:hypothetical protein
MSLLPPTTVVIKERVQPLQIIQYPKPIDFIASANYSSVLNEAGTPSRPRNYNQ